MTFKLWGRKSDESDNKIEKAQQKVNELERRSETVTEALRERIRRNHWGETVAEIARGGR